MTKSLRRGDLINILRLTIIGGLYCNKNKYTCLIRPALGPQPTNSVTHTEQETAHPQAYLFPGQQIQDQIMPEQYN